MELTDRELAILSLTALGFSSKEIVSKMGLSFSNVKYLKAKILRKLRVKNMVEAITITLLRGEITGKSE